MISKMADVEMSGAYGKEKVLVNGEDLTSCLRSAALTFKVGRVPTLVLEVNRTSPNAEIRAQIVRLNTETPTELEQRMFEMIDELLQDHGRLYEETSMEPSRLEEIKEFMKMMSQ